MLPLSNVSVIKENYSFRKPEDGWSKEEDGIVLRYPVFHHDRSNPNDLIIKKTLREVISDIDFHRWKENKDVRLEDSDGKAFLVQDDSKEKIKSSSYRLNIIWE